MTIQVQVKGQTVEFPDGTPEDTIHAAIRRDFFGGGPSLSDQARERHAQLIRETQGQIDPKTGQPTYADTGLAHELAQTAPVQFGRGVVKSGLNTAYHLGEMVRGGAEAGPNDITEALKPANTAQEIGKVAGDVGQFFVPGVAGAGRLTKAAATMQRMGLVGDIAKAAATGGVVTAAEGGSPAAGAIGGAAGAGAAGALGKLAPRLINSQIGAKKAAFMYDANPGKGISDERIVAKGLISQFNKVNAKMEQVGDKIGTVLGLSPKANTVRVDAASLFEPIIKKAEEAVKWTDPSKLASLQTLRDALYSGFTDLQSSASNATPREIWIARKAIDDSNKLFGGSEGAAASNKEVLKGIRFAFKKAIEAAVPEIKPINARYANLAEASHVIHDKIAGSQGLPGLSQSMMHFGPAGVATWLTHSPVAGLATLAGTAALRTAPVATVGAQALRGIGSEEGRMFLSRLAAAFASESTQGNDTEKNP